VATVTGLVLGISLLLSGCSAGVPTPSFHPILLVISDQAATGPDFVAAERIESVRDIDYFELRISRDFASVIVMTTGTTDTAGSVETADRMAIAEMCGEEDHGRPCIFSYDADTAPNEQRTDAFNSMPPSGNFVWEGSLPGPAADAEFRTYYIRVTGEGGATGNYVLTVELNEGEGPMYS